MVEPKPAIPDVFLYKFGFTRTQSLRSRVWTDVRATENDSTRLYKNGDISVVISYSQLFIKFCLMLSMILCCREIRPDTDKTIKNEFVANFFLNGYPEKRIRTKLLCC